LQESPCTETLRVCKVFATDEIIAIGTIGSRQWDNGTMGQWDNGNGRKEKGKRKKEKGKGGGRREKRTTKEMTSSAEESGLLIWAFKSKKFEL